jgi:hypothetical protein
MPSPSFHFPQNPFPFVPFFPFFLSCTSYKMSCNASSAAAAAPVKVRVTVSGSSCTCCGFKEVDQLPSQPVFERADDILALQDSLVDLEGEGEGVTFAGYVAALKAHVREKTAGVCKDGALPPAPLYHIPAYREHSPTFSFLWTRGPASAVRWTSEYGLDAEAVWEYIGALFFLHRVAGNLARRGGMAPPANVTAADVAAVYARLGELHAVFKAAVLPAATLAAET